MSSFKDLAEEIKIFHGLTPKQLDHIEPFIEKKIFKARARLLTEGEDAQGMFLISSGKAQVLKSGAQDQELTPLGELKQGDIFGEMSLIDCQPRSATVVATGDLTTYYLPYKAMNLLYENHPKTFGLLILNIAREVSRRLRQLDQAFVESKKNPNP